MRKTKIHVLSMLLIAMILAVSCSSGPSLSREIIVPDWLVDSWSCVEDPASSMTLTEDNMIMYANELIVMDLKSMLELNPQTGIAQQDSTDNTYIMRMLNTATGAQLMLNFVYTESADTVVLTMSGDTYPVPVTLSFTRG